MKFWKKSSQPKCPNFTWDGFKEDISNADVEIARQFGSSDTARKMIKMLDEAYFHDVLFRAQTSVEYRNSFINTRNRLYNFLHPADGAVSPKEETTSMDGI